MNFKQTAIKIYSNRYGRWLLHLLFWFFIFAARYYISIISLNPYKNYAAGILLNSLFATINTAVAYYLLVGFIYEKLLRRKKYLAGILSIFLLVVIYTYLDYIAEMLLLQHEKWKAIMLRYNPEYYEYLQQNTSNIMLKRIVTMGILFQLFIAISLPLFIKIAIAYGREQLVRLELSKQNIQLEYNFLKSQVNPHFLFNTLNNIYSLVLHDQKEKATDTIARLSAFMRYTLHDASFDKASSAKEIKLMRDYIELEKLRVNHTEIRTCFETDMDYALPPLLFIPIVENTFKHCTDSNGSFIDIKLTISDSQLNFTCCNSFDAAHARSVKGGIGLTNINRRLQQYYPGKYLKVVSKENGVYSVNLSINLV